MENQKAKAGYDTGDNRKDLVDRLKTIRCKMISKFPIRNWDEVETIEEAIDELETLALIRANVNILHSLTEGTNADSN